MPPNDTPTGTPRPAPPTSDAIETGAGPLVDARLRDLEGEMPQLFLRHNSIFALASAWAERYDAIVAMTPAAARATVEARLARIGIRWGVMPGSRVTVEFRTSDIEELARARRTRRG